MSFCTEIKASKLLLIFSHHIKTTLIVDQTDYRKWKQVKSNFRLCDLVYVSEWRDLGFLNRFLRALLLKVDSRSHCTYKWKLIQVAYVSVRAKDWTVSDTSFEWKEFTVSSQNSRISYLSNMPDIVSHSVEWL